MIEGQLVSRNDLPQVYMSKYERVLKHHFDKYIEALALNRQRFEIDDIGISP